MENHLNFSKIISEAMDPGSVASEALDDALGDTDAFWLIRPKTQTKSIPYITEQGMLVVFLSKTCAERYAALSGPADDMDLKCFSRKELFGFLEQALDTKTISGIFVYWIPPFGLGCTDPETICKVFGKKKRDPGVSFDSEVNKTQKLLQFLDVKDREELDPNYELIISNAHVLVNHFVEMFGLTAEGISEKTGLEAAKISRFCEDYADSAVFDRNEFRTLLQYFGVADYLYRFKSDCDELERWVNNHAVLNKYTLSFTKPERIREVFTVQSVTPGRTKEDNALIYQITLNAKTRSIDVLVTDPTGCIRNRRCEILNLEETIDDNEGEAEANEAQTKHLISDEKIQQAKADFASKPGAGQGRRTRAQTRTFTSTDEV